MGYSMRSWSYRFTLWLGFNPNTFQVGGVISNMQQPGCSTASHFLSTVQANMTDVHAGEFYQLGEDPGEDHNDYWSLQDLLVLSKMAQLPMVRPSPVALSPPVTTCSH